MRIGIAWVIGFAAAATLSGTALAGDEERHVRFDDEVRVHGESPDQRRARQSEPGPSTSPSKPSTSRSKPSTSGGGREASKSVLSKPRKASSSALGNKGKQPASPRGARPAAGSPGRADKGRADRSRADKGKAPARVSTGSSTSSVVPRITQQQAERMRSPDKDTRRWGNSHLRDKGKSPAHSGKSASPQRTRGKPSASAGGRAPRGSKGRKGGSGGKGSRGGSKGGKGGGKRK